MATADNAGMADEWTGVHVEMVEMVRRILCRVEEWVCSSTR